MPSTTKQLQCDATVSVSDGGNVDLLNLMCRPSSSVNQIQDLSRVKEECLLLMRSAPPIDTGDAKVDVLMNRYRKDLEDKLQYVDNVDDFWVVFVFLSSTFFTLLQLAYYTANHYVEFCVYVGKTWDKIRQFFSGLGVLSLIVVAAMASTQVGMQALTALALAASNLLQKGLNQAAAVLLPKLTDAAQQAIVSAVTNSEVSSALAMSTVKAGVDIIIKNPSMSAAMGAALVNSPAVQQALQTLMNMQSEVIQTRAETMRMTENSLKLVQEMHSEANLAIRDDVAQVAKDVALLQARLATFQQSATYQNVVNAISPLLANLGPAAVTAVSNLLITNPPTNLLTYFGGAKRRSMKRKTKSRRRTTRGKRGARRRGRYFRQSRRGT